MVITFDFRSSEPEIELLIFVFFIFRIFRFLTPKKKKKKEKKREGVLRRARTTDQLLYPDFPVRMRFY